ncbi:hypothetical protein E4T56_gene3925, partial [Termitomyces sp. T112]
MAPSSDQISFRAALTRAKNVLILSGAGLSAASGIATYRNADDSLWNNFVGWFNHVILSVIYVSSGKDPKKYATPEAFKKDPVDLWTFYHRRRSAYLLAKPNAAHYALATLAHPPTLARIAPSTAQPIHVTQNVD